MLRRMLLLLSAVLGPASAGAAPEAPVPALRLAYTAAIGGQIEPCG